MSISDEIKSTKFESGRDKAMINIVYTANWFRDLHKSALKKYDILPQHFNVLRIINGRYPNPISPGEIKDVILDKGPDVTRLVDKLVRLGWVDRCPCNDNRRVMEIRVSEKGREVLKQMSGDISQLTSKRFGLTEEESLLLSDLLDKARAK